MIFRLAEDVSETTPPRSAVLGDSLAPGRHPARPPFWPRFLPRFYSRSSVLGLLWLGAVFLPLIALVLGGWMTWRLVVESEIGRMARATEAARSQTLRTLETGDATLAAVAARIDGWDWARITSDPELAAFVRRLAAPSLALVARDGRVVLSTGVPPGRLPADSFPSGGETAAIAADDSGGETRLRLVRSLRDSAGQGGSLILSFDPGVFERMFAHLVPTPGAGLALLDASGRVGVHTAGLVPGAAVAIARAGAGEAGMPGGLFWLREGSLLNEFHLAVVRPVEAYHLLLVYRADPGALRAQWGRDMTPIALGTLMMMVLLGALTVQAQRRLADERELAARLAASERAAAQERAEAEVRLREVEKVAALGQLAAGVAHDFNNLLQSILVSADSLAQPNLPRGEARQVAALILHACERGMALTRRMLEFARRDRLSAETADIAQALLGVGELLGRLLGRSYRVRITSPSEGLLVGCHPAEFESVIINLAVNARDAMPKGGEITIDLTTPPDAARCARVVVGDTGCGMDAETLARVGEAFFTTKERGRGTGLGLSMADNFARRCGGRLDIDSVLGQGTRVSLTLPLA